MSDALFSAKEARALQSRAAVVDGLFQREETLKVLEAIKVASLRGDSYVNVGYCHAVVLQRLNVLGYTTKWHDSVQREPGYTTVSWEYIHDGRGPG